MITFEDGPAKNVTLTLGRCPTFLRVTRKNRVVFDALDQLEDEPTPEEELFAYCRIGEVTRGFVDYRGKEGRRGGFFGYFGTLV